MHRAEMVAERWKRLKCAEVVSRWDSDVKWDISYDAAAVECNRDARQREMRWIYLLCQLQLITSAAPEEMA